MNGRCGFRCALVIGALGAALLAPRSAFARVDVIRLAKVISEGVPRGLVTMIIPLPAELANDAEVSYEVRVTGEIEVLGRLSGPARIGGGPAKPLVLTLRVPALADAGEKNAANVIFRGSNGREYVVPLVLRVSVVRSLNLLGPLEMRGLRSGDRVELIYRIVNAGNASDSVRIVIRTPAGWMARLGRPALTEIPARRQLEFTVALGIPPSANIGDHALSVTLRPVDGLNGGPVTYTTLGITGRAGESPGLVVRSTVAAATGSGGSAAYSGVEIAGPVTTGIGMRARFTPTTQRTGLTTQALSAVGAMSAPFSASLYGSWWDIDAGNTSVQLSDLGGVNIIGQGVTAQIDRPGLEARAIVARPVSGSQELGGQLVGAGFWRDLGIGRIGGTASWLAERGATSPGRELTAVGIDYRTPELGTLTFGASVAHRSSAAVDGLGYSVNAMHAGAKSRASLRLTHAPGGTSAFARAVDEWQFEGAREVTRWWTLDLAAQRSVDAGLRFTGMEVRGFSIGQRLALSRSTSLALRGTSSDFLANDEGSGIGSFGASERSGVASVEWRRALLALSLEGALGMVGRSTELLGGALSESVAPRRHLRAGASQAFDRWGVVGGNLSVEQTAAGVGVPGEVLAGTFRWSEVPLALGTRQIQLGAEASLQRMGDLRTTVVLRTSMRVALPAGLDLAVVAERNPYFQNANGRPGWSAAMRLSAATRLYAPHPMGPEGTVYEDRDSDGKRDPLESGIGGVIVRRGEAKATTDRFGHYRLPLNARGRTRIDQGTLPAGLIAHPLLAADSLERLDLPVLPTGSTTIQLEIVADEGGRVPDVDLEPVTVMLRDASGFDWVGRRTGKGTATFEGIPTGRYTMHFDFSRLREPLRGPADLIVEIAPHVRSTTYVPVRGRAVRIFAPPTRSLTTEPHDPERTR